MEQFLIQYNYKYGVDTNMSTNNVSSVDIILKYIV